MFIRIGHRGAAGYEPENTLRSFRRALEIGVDVVEFDVYSCRSGELVVIHDDRVDRTTNGRGYVTDLTFDELRRLDAGKGERIPLLEEVLDCVDRKAAVNIELKGEKTAAPVSAVVKSYLKKGWLEEHFIVSSFNHYELVEFRRLMPSIRTGALITAIPIGYAEFGERLGAWSVNPSMEFIDKAFVDDAHRRGLKVLVFTPDIPEDIARMKTLGVDGAFSNFPDRLR